MSRHKQTIRGHQVFNHMQSWPSCLVPNPLVGHSLCQWGLCCPLPLSLPLAGWGSCLLARQSLTRGAPPRQKDFLIIMSLHCVYIGLHLNIYEMIITPVVDGYERYELFVNAVESTLHGILHGVEKWWELLWKWMKESKWKTNTKIAKPFVQISLILSHHK